MSLSNTTCLMISLVGPRFIARSPSNKKCLRISSDGPGIKTRALSNETCLIISPQHPGSTSASPSNWKFQRFSPVRAGFILGPLYNGVCLISFWRPQGLHPHLPPLNLKKQRLDYKDPLKLQHASKQKVVSGSLGNILLKFPECQMLTPKWVFWKLEDCLSLVWFNLF